MAFAKTEREWAERAARHLKAELKRADVTYEQLAERLKKHGFDESKASIANKLARATVSAHFFLAALFVIGCEVSHWRVFNSAEEVLGMAAWRVFLCAVVLMAVSAESAQSQRRPPNRNQTQSTQQPAATDQRGTNQAPLVVKVLPPEDAEDKAKQEAADRAAKDQFDTNTLILGIATVVVAFLQFVAIGVQAIFLWFAFKAAKDAVNAAEKQAKIADRL
jgi:hypothetical protein